MTTPRYRRSSVRAVLETVTQDHAAANAAHDALWAVLWSRRYDDVDEPVWLPDAAYAGILAFARHFPEGTSLSGIDTGESLVVFRGLPVTTPVGSRVRVLPAAREQWRFGEGTQTLGLGIELRFDEPGHLAETDWVGALRTGIQALGEALDERRERLSARRAQLGALNEPPSLEEIWREQLSAISDRVMLETEYTSEEHTALQKAKAKGPRFADEEERKIVAARRKRFTERGNDEVARFRSDAWPAIRDAAVEEIRKYTTYRNEVVKLEDALQRVRAYSERAMKAYRMLDPIEGAGFRVTAFAFDPGRLSDPVYAEELLRTIELLYAAIPKRVQGSAATFSGYRAPTAGPAVIPPRV